MKNSDLDLLLIGNAVKDNIFERDALPIIQWGGIYNVFRSFSSQFPYKSVNVSPINFGEAYIFIDRERATKSVSANLNIANIKPQHFNSKWTHIAYANHLPIEDITVSSQSIVSLDICAGEELHVDYICPDYIFVSEDEHDINKLSERYPKSKVIFHDKHRVGILINRYQQCLFSVEEKRNINILGAGDFLAASFIGNRLDGCDDKESLSIAIKSMDSFFKSN